jgi:uncharacterized protein (DUF433 family)
MNTDPSIYSNRITIDPEICNGRPTIRGMRITVQTVLEFLAAGDDPRDILEAYPVLEAEDIQACLSAAARVFSERTTVTYAGV